jgi:hypothetical protein
MESEMWCEWLPDAITLAFVVVCIAALVDGLHRAGRWLFRRLE